MLTASTPPAHTKITHGLCPICNHYGDDCTGSSAHAPGPWKTDAYGEYIAVYDADGCRIADVYAAPTVDEDKEAFASARLIAAAPDLLAACKDAYANGCIQDSRSDGEALDDVLEILKNAIAKAA